MLRSSRNVTPAHSFEAATLLSPASHEEAAASDGHDPDPPSADLLDIVNLTIEYRIPTVHTISTGAGSNPENESQPFVLGDGVTCLVSTHELTSDVGEGPSRIKCGTVVALKQYTGPSTSESSRGTTSGSNDLAPYSFLAQEIRVLCHEQLRQNENITSILFLGYSTQTAIPLLGLELAEHGTLDFVLRCPGRGPSIIDRANLTLDMALGLDALHSCGIAHGDLKLDNVLVFSHPQRRIVAKLADFGGSCIMAPDETQNLTARPRHHTEMWDSPEMVANDTHIDWCKADVYSFGLIAASLWMRTATYQPLALDPKFSACVLERLVPRQFFTDTESQYWLETIKLWKLRRDAEKNSVISETSKLLEWILEKEATALPFVLPLLNATLKTIPSERASIGQVLHAMFENMACPEIDERLRTAIEATTPSAIPTHGGTKLFRVWSEEYFRTPYDWKAIILQHMIVKVQPLRRLDDGYFPGLDALLNDADQNLIEVLRGLSRAFFRGTMRKTSLSAEDVQRSSRLALHIAFSFLLGLGTPINGTEGGRWLCLSALCGNVIAINTLSEIYDVFPDFPPGVENRVPLNFFLSLTSLAGSNAALKKLERRNSHLASLVVALRTTHAVTSYIEGGGGPFMIEMIMAYFNNPPDRTELNTFNAAVEHGDMDKIVQLAGSLHQVGPDELHYLTYLDGAAVESCCKDFFAAGAKLDARPSKHTLSMLLRARSSSGEANWSPWSGLSHELPLLRAIEEKNVPLALALIDLHERHRVYIEDHRKALILAASWHLDTVVRGLLQLKQRYPSLCGAGIGEQLSETLNDDYSSRGARSRGISDPTWPNTDLEICLCAVLRPYGAMRLKRLAVHGADADIREAEVLHAIFNATDDLSIELFPSYFRACVTWDLLNPLTVGLDRLRQAGHEPRQFLPAQFLRTCVIDRALGCMRALTLQYPDSAMDKSKYGTTALHIAAMTNDLEMLELLLQVCGEEIARQIEVFGDSLIRYALLSGHSEAATMIQLNLVNLSSKSEGQAMNASPSPSFTSPQTFVRLVLQWSEERSEEILDSIRWLLANSRCMPLRQRPAQPISSEDIRPGTLEQDTESKGTAPQYPQGVKEIVTIWHEIISTPVFGFTSRLNLDRLLLQVLFEYFPQYVSFVDCKGWNPLHTAVWNGHVTGVELLIEHGVDVNSETGVEYAHASHRQVVEAFFPGHTALNLATEALMRLPPRRIQTGGFRELNEWEDRLRLIIKLLARKGATSGSGAGKRAQTAAFRFTQPNVHTMFYGLTGLEDRRRHITYSGSWPKPALAISTDSSEEKMPEKDASTWWSSKMPILHDYFDREYGVWPDPPWLKDFSDMDRYLDAVQKQLRKVDVIIALKRVLSSKTDTRLAADGSIYLFDRTSSVWLREEEWRSRAVDAEPNSVSDKITDLSISGP